MNSVDPIEVRILKDLQTRCQAISIRTEGYYTDIGSNVQRRPVTNLDKCDLPVMSVLSGSPAGEDRKAASQLSGFPITIEAHKEIEDHDNPEDEGWQMANDIYRAVEKRFDPSKPKALVVNRIEFVSSAVAYPEGERAIVSAIVEYSVNYSRVFGNK